MDGIKLPANLDREAFSKKAMAIYDQKYRIQMEASMRGKVAAIELESEEAFLGRTALEAAMQAREKFPDRLLYFIRVGYPAVHSQKGAGRRIAARENA